MIINGSLLITFEERSTFGFIVEEKIGLSLNSTKTKSSKEMISTYVHLSLFFFLFLLCMFSFSNSFVAYFPTSFRFLVLYYEHIYVERKPYNEAKMSMIFWHVTINK